MQRLGLKMLNVCWSRVLRHGVGAATSEQLAAVVAAAPPAFVAV